MQSSIQCVFAPPSDRTTTLYLLFSDLDNQSPNLLVFIFLARFIMLLAKDLGSSFGGRLLVLQWSIICFMASFMIGLMQSSIHYVFAPTNDPTKTWCLLFSDLDDLSPNLLAFYIFGEIYNIISDRFRIFLCRWIISSTMEYYCLCDPYGSRDFEMAMILPSSRAFFINIVSEVGQTYRQNGRKLRVEVFLSTTIFCKHLNMASKLMRYENACVVFNFPSSLHKVMSSSKHREQSILCIKTCKVLVS